MIHFGMIHFYPLNLNHLNKSSIICNLGSGTYGKIKLYKCKEVHNGEIEECSKYFVVKHLKCKKFWKYFDKNTEAKMIKSLFNEYKIGSLLHHPSIRETIDIDLIDNCIIFEYCDGLDFFNYIMNNPNEKLVNINCDLYFYYKQIIEAINYIHNLHIAHLDLKLENIMINVITKTVKLIDFGESRICINNKLNGIHGTIPYIAPEEFTDKEYDPFKIDIWALGIILYDILYIQFPWKIAKKTDFKYKRFVTLYNDNFDKCLPSPIPCDILLNILKNTLNPNPEQRYNIGQIIKETTLQKS